MGAAPRVGELRGLVLWPYENVPFGNVAPASWPAVTWASRPTSTRLIEHLHPVTDLALFMRSGVRLYFEKN